VDLLEHVVPVWAQVGRPCVLAAGEYFTLYRITFQIGYLRTRVVNFNQFIVFNNVEILFCPC